jgi:hypothetical protein
VALADDAGVAAEAAPAPDKGARPLAA